MAFTAVYQKVVEGYIGFIEELPGANTQGKTLEETRENLKEAVQLILESNKYISEKEMEGKTVIKEEFKVSY